MFIKGTRVSKEEWISDDSKKEKLGIFLSMIIGFAWPIILLLSILTKLFTVIVTSKTMLIIRRKCQTSGITFERKRIKLEMKKHDKAGFIVVPANDYTEQLMRKIDMENYIINPPKRS